MNENDLRTRLVPAICTQCGARLEVDPTQDAAVCRYCNTPFIVEKAIQNYSVQNAKIEHVDTVKIDMKGTADSFFGFLGEQMSESREARREERRERREESREMNRGFLKIFGYMMIGMMVLALVLFLVQNFFGSPDDKQPNAAEPAAVSTRLPAENAKGTDDNLELSIRFDSNSAGRT